MSLFFRERPRRNQLIATTSGVIFPGQEWFGGYKRSNPSTMDESLQSVALHAVVDLIASVVSELPVDVFTGKPNDRRPVTPPGYLDDPAGDGYGRQDWLYQVVECWLLRGNEYGRILARGGGGTFPTQIDLQHPDTVRVLEVDGVQWWFNGTEVDESQVHHTRCYPTPGRIQGLSVVSKHAADLGLDLTLTDFGLDYFRHGAAPASVISNSEKSIESESVAKAIKKRFLDAMNGREPVVLGKGWQWTQIPINPEESQFLESRNFSGAQIAKLFGPGIAELLGYSTSGSGSLTYANVNDRSVQLLVYAIGKWVRRADRLLSSMLPRPQVARLDRDAILETTTMQRYLAHAAAVNAGWKTPNEVRKDEDLLPLPGGDELKAPQPAAQPAGATDGGSNG